MAMVVIAAAMDIHAKRVREERPFEVVLFSIISNPHFLDLCVILHFQIFHEKRKISVFFNT